jgi:hypothetical protein
MTEIILNLEQAKIVTTARDGVLVRDPSGLVIGRIVSPFTREEIEAAERLVDSGAPTRTSAQVWERIHSLERS